MEAHSSSPLTLTSPIAKKVRRNRLATSEVWNHFHGPDENDEDPIAVCVHCGKEYLCRSFHGTSNLWKHLRFQCPMAPLKDQAMRKKEHGTPKQFYSYDECRRALVDMIIMDEMAFRVVEGEGFIKYSNTLQPRFEIPSRTTVARDAIQIFVEEKEKMKQILKKQRISLTTDTWTSNQNMNYMCLTAHWIDDRWQLQRRVINFCLVDDHRGETIGRKIEECLLEWGVDRIFTITVDNASSNNGAINYIKDLSKTWEGTILQHEFIHMRCCAHIVNLIVKSGLEVTNESIDKIRIAVRFVRSSPARLNQFKKCAEKEKISRKRLLSLDVETRWNATYLMLDNAIIFEKAFARLNKENKQFKTYFVDHLPPTETDWRNARRVIHFLKIFHKVTVRLSGSLHVTSSAFFHEFVLMQSKLKELAVHGDPIIAAMADRMKKKFSKYWEDKDDLNNLLFIALILDPRYKVKFLSFFFLGIYGPEKKTELVGKIEGDLRRLFDCYVESVTYASLNSNYNQPPLLINVDEHEEDPSMLLASQFAMHLEEIESRESNSELSRYLTENCEKITDDFDLLMWWRCNSSKYPILSTLAKDILAVPVSTVASESSFSTGGRILDSFRTSLSPTTVEALICTQSWLRSPSGPIDIIKSMEEIEAYEEIQEGIVV